MNVNYNADYLAAHDPPVVAAWYLRLADFVDANNKAVKESLAAKMLRHYLKGRGQKLIFDPPDHLKTSKFVVDVLKKHRAWYLTEEKFKDKWAGIIPRLQVAERQREKNNIPIPLVWEMNLNSLVEIATKSGKPGYTNTPDDDLMTALHGFQLHTYCKLALAFIYPWPNRYKVMFMEFRASVKDRYDFAATEYFIVPNPDYGKGPIRPDQERIAVWHKNAIRVEKAGLAAPFDLESKEWTDKALLAPAQIDTTKKLT